jgi:hypothetical protein
MKALKKNWVNEVLDSATKTVRSWPEWMQRPEVRAPGGAARPHARPAEPTQQADELASRKPEGK